MLTPRLSLPVVSSLIFCLASFSPVRARAADPPKGEIRALWVTRWDFKTEKDIRRAVRWSAAVGFNRIFLQVRGRADAFYRSSIEPWGEEIGGRDPGFDPLQTAIEESQKTGIQLHAWINVLPAWKGNTPPRDPGHVLHRYPEWFIEDSNGKRHMLDAADYTILNPCLPEVRSYLVRVVSDIVSRYAVDGVHFDYVRFVGKETAGEAEFPYDPRSLALFRKFAAGSPKTAPEEWERWKRASVNTVIYRLSKAVKEVRPKAVVSVAVLQDYGRARKKFLQDVVAWQSFPYLDEIYPMTYHESSADFAFYADAALRGMTAKKVIPGIGAHLHDRVSQTTRQIQVSRTLGAAGYCVFGFASLFPSPSHESKGDEASRRLRAELRAALLSLNGKKKPAGDSPTAARPESGASTPKL